MADQGVRKMFAFGALAAPLLPLALVGLARWGDAAPWLYGLAVFGGAGVMMLYAATGLLCWRLLKAGDVAP